MCLSMSRSVSSGCLFVWSERPTEVRASWRRRCQATGRLHWVSQEGETGVHTFCPGTGEHSSFPTSALTPAVALTSQPDVLAVFLEQRIVAMNLDGEVGGGWWNHSDACFSHFFDVEIECYRR